MVWASGGDQPAALPPKSRASRNSNRGVFLRVAQRTTTTAGQAREGDVRGPRTACVSASGHRRRPSCVETISQTARGPGTTAQRRRCRRARTRPPPRRELARGGYWSACCKPTRGRLCCLHWVSPVHAAPRRSPVTGDRHAHVQMVTGDRHAITDGHGRPPHSWWSCSRAQET